ncbi:heme-degrading domain-containing protein [Methylobrevis albus]|uniref:UPF0303 protein I5731_05080 n=1 Tax=Methylobrevis albus TaxID=2793297 RepID=A0A931MXI8_9HYPH|nr:heme-degrading domain-containing protein [Methylobrevis albus]MBH0237187.1 heme-degrading domain-containing protein [Methylobrevis albus]
MADPIPLDDLLEQERSLVFTRFDNETAIALGLDILARGRARGLPITVDVSRAGQQLFHAALAGTAADNDRWVERKSAVVYRFGHSSLYVGELCRQQGLSFEAKFLVDPRTYAAHGGAFPITVKDVGLVGVVTVSGLPQRDDHALVVEALAEFLSR